MARITTARVGDALFRRRASVSNPKTKKLMVIVQGDFASLSSDVRKKIAVKKAEFNGRQGSNTKTTYCCKRIRVLDDYAILTLHRKKTTRSAKGSKNMNRTGGSGPVSGCFTVSLRLGPGGPIEDCWFDAVEYVE